MDDDSPLEPGVSAPTWPSPCKRERARRLGARVAQIKPRFVFEQQISTPAKPAPSPVAGEGLGGADYNNAPN